MTSPSVAIEITAPAIDSVRITPSSPLAGDTLTANVTGHDVDGDSIAYSYQWFVNGVAVDGAPGATLDLAGIAGKHAIR